jgi:hypothetical protein
MLKEYIYNAQVTIETSKNTLHNPPYYYRFFCPFTLPSFSPLFCFPHSLRSTALHISLEFRTVQDDPLNQHRQKQVGPIKADQNFESDRTFLLNVESLMNSHGSL